MSLSSGGTSNLERHMNDDDDLKADKKATGYTPKIRRRNRMIMSCLECRRRKLKCDKLHPCTNCSKFSRDCMFLAPALDSVSQMKLTEIKEKMGSLERVLEEDVARKPQTKFPKQSDRRRASTELPGQADTDSDEDPAPEDEKDLEATPLAVVDASYEGEGDDDMLDLGIRVGKMRLTERLGGFFRPKMSEELAFTISDPSNDRRTAEEKAFAIPLSPNSAEGFLEPGPTYIAPGSGFVLGDVGVRRSLMDFLPSKFAADTLAEQYLRNVHFIAKVVHWPSFQLQYDNFWTNVLMGIEPTPSAQALMFSVMFSAVASMTEAEISVTFQRPKRAVLANFQTGTEVALGKAQFLRTTKMETLQALVIYLIPMCRSEISRAHSVLVGTAIRLAECMGLHRDPSLVYGMSPIECHVRRTIWFQLCFLDVRTCESQGPRPGIHRDDYDTHFPLNINDTDLLTAEPKEIERSWTDMTFSRIRFESNEMHRVVWFDRLRLEKKQVSITHLLGKIESFRKAMEEKYNPIIDENVPIQKLAKLMMGIQLLRMHVMVLHRYHNSVSIRIPDRLRQIILTSGTQQMENAVQIDTLPELAPWRWYAGAFQQWQTAFLLLVEIFTYPMRKEADRIWAVVDYVFEPDRSLSRAQKGRSILSDLRDRIGIYRDIRKVRAPVSMTKRLYTRPPRRVGDVLDPNSPPNKPKEPTQIEQARGSKNSVSGSSTAASPHHLSDTASPFNSSDPSFHSWSYDTPATLFLNRGYTKEETSQVPGLSNRPPSAGCNFEPVAQQFGGMGSPPSDIGTGDSWPPLISNQQQGWNALLPTTYSGMSTSQISSAISAEQNVPGEIGQSLVVVDAPFGNGQPTGALPGISAQGSDPMALDIDWGEWDKIFPPSVNTGVLNMSENVDMS